MKTYGIIFGIAAALALAPAASADVLTGVTVTSSFVDPGGIESGPYDTLAPGTLHDRLTTSFSLVYSGDSITIVADKPGFQVTFTGSGFNGIVFTVPSTVTLTNVETDAATNLANWDGTGLAFTAQEIDVNLKGMTFDYGTQLVLDLDGTGPSDVPEPASVALFGGGLAALGLLRRRSTKAISH